MKIYFPKSWEITHKPSAKNNGVFSAAFFEANSQIVQFGFNVTVGLVPVHKPEWLNAHDIPEETVRDFTIRNDEYSYTSQIHQVQKKFLNGIPAWYFEGSYKQRDIDTEFRFREYVVYGNSKTYVYITAILETQYECAKDLIEAMEMKFSFEAVEKAPEQIIQDCDEANHPHSRSSFKQFNSKNASYTLMYPKTWKDFHQESKEMILEEYVRDQNTSTTISIVKTNDEKLVSAFQLPEKVVIEVLGKQGTSKDVSDNQTKIQRTSLSGLDAWQFSTQFLASNTGEVLVANGYLVVHKHNIYIILNTSRKAELDCLQRTYDFINKSFVFK